MTDSRPATKTAIRGSRRIRPAYRHSHGCDGAPMHCRRNTGKGRATRPRAKSKRACDVSSRASANVLGCKPLTVGAPTGRTEDHTQRFPHRLGGQEVANDGRPFVKGDANRIEGLDILDDSI